MNKYAYKKLKMRPFIKKIRKQTINPTVLSNALATCNTECPFSTFPYIAHNLNSKQALREFSSGNCVALALFIKGKLLKEHGLKSHLIPATIPSQVRDNLPFLDICHVALAVPENKKTIHILDPAFYFLKPITSESTREEGYMGVGELQDFTTHQRQTFKYRQERLRKKLRLNKYQTVPRGTRLVTCTQQEDPTQKWSYFLTEVLNPDHAISRHFLNIRGPPWITVNDAGYNTTLYLRMLPNEHIRVVQHGNTTYEGAVEDLPTRIHKEIKPILKNYLGETVEHFRIPDHFFFFEPRTRKRRYTRRRRRRRTMRHRSSNK